MELVDNAFNILLNNLENVRVEAKSVLDIPIVYTPTEMKRHAISLVVEARRGEDEYSWGISRDQKYTFKKKRF